MSFTPVLILDTTTTDDYQYLRCPGCSHLTLQIQNAMVNIGYGRVLETGGSAVYAPNDEPFTPVVGGIDRPPFDEIRVKSYTPGTPARVFIRAT